MTVDGVPYEAGIDPYNKLVDRVSDDNRHEGYDERAGASAP